MPYGVALICSSGSIIIIISRGSRYTIMKSEEEAAPPAYVCHFAESRTQLYYTLFSKLHFDALFKHTHRTPTLFKGLLYFPRTIRAKQPFGAGSLRISRAPLDQLHLCSCNLSTLGPLPCSGSWSAVRLMAYGEHHDDDDDDDVVQQQQQQHPSGLRFL